ncbi:MAG: hypothetical protein ACRDBH_03565 [Bosea sp. (in: a-proteobacteria)]
MQQIGPYLFYASIALVVPVLIARFVVRADWRTIRNACIIWYGLLILAFNGLFDPKGFGWAMIFAMFFSIPAVPLAALGLRLLSRAWRELRGGSQGDPSP